MNKREADKLADRAAAVAIHEAKQASQAVARIRVESSSNAVKAKAAYAYACIVDLEDVLRRESGQL